MLDLNERTGNKRVIAVLEYLKRLCCKNREA